MLTKLSADNAGTKELLNEVKNNTEDGHATLDKLKTAVGENCIALDEIKTTATENRGILDELKTATGENRSALEDIFTVLQATKSEVTDIKAENASKPHTSEEDLVKALNDLLSNHAEVSTNIRNLKTATDENKNTIKSAIDSSIYGLKQDNKEIVEFLQRMNTNILKKGEDDEKAAQKEEEAAAKAEEERRQLEERFKAAEDFMHKESVKVYRNVQAVINEKNDKQKESVESANLSVEKRVSKVKALVVIDMVFTLITLATMILYIFGFLGAH